MRQTFDRIERGLEGGDAVRSWIVGFWERVFAVLSWISLFRILRRFAKPLNSPGGVEAWVAGNLLLALGGATAAACAPDSIVVRVLVIYGLLRVFEITVYQINVLLFDQLRARRGGQRYALEGYARIVLLLLQNYLEVIFWFAAAYGVLVPVLGPVTRSLPVLLHESFATFTGFGTSHLEPRSGVALACVWAESAGGLFMSIIVLARFIGMLPKPESRTPGESRDE
jgi:hypothetical protein